MISSLAMAFEYSLERKDLAQKIQSAIKIFINHFSLAGSTIINDARSRDLGTGPLDADLGQYKVYIEHLKLCGVRLVKQEWCQGSLVRHCNVKSYSKTDQHH